MPGLVQQQHMKWSVQFSLRVPPVAPPIVPVGAIPFWIHKTKILFHVSL